MLVLGPKAFWFERIIREKREKNKDSIPNHLYNKEPVTPSEYAYLDK